LNALAPPKEMGGCVRAAQQNVAAERYHWRNTAQVPPWWVEAERLGQEFRRTHQERHLQALARHLNGIFERLTTGGVQ
jgi:hypothetical protein